MNKKVFGKKLSRGRGARKALFASLIKSLISNEKIVTSKAKANAIKGQLMGYLHLAKAGGLTARRGVLSELKNDKKTVESIFSKKFLSFRITNMPPRKGDNAPMVKMELIKRVEEKPESKNENVSAKTKRS